MAMNTLSINSTLDAVRTATGVTVGVSPTGVGAHSTLLALNSFAAVATAIFLGSSTNSATEASVTYIVPRACSTTIMAVRISTGAINTRTVVLRVNGVDSAMAVTFTGATLVLTSTTAVALAANDAISVVTRTSGGIVPNAIIQCTINCVFA
jgi:hypothetical protein